MTFEHPVEASSSPESMEFQQGIVHHDVEIIVDTWNRHDDVELYADVKKIDDAERAFDQIHSLLPPEDAHYIASALHRARDRQNTGATAYIAEIDGWLQAHLGEVVVESEGVVHEVVGVGEEQGCMMPVAMNELGEREVITAIDRAYCIWKKDDDK